MSSDLILPMRPVQPRIRPARAVFVAVILSGLLGVEQTLAQPASDAPRISASAEVAILGIDVVVTGPDRKAVHGLTAADFDVFYGGKAVAITNFHEERNAADGLPETAPGGTPGTPGGEPEARPKTQRLPRRMVVFIDRVFLPEPFRREQVFDGLKDCLQKALGPGDEAMVVSWGDSLQIVHSFSSDLNELGKTIDAVARQAARLDAFSLELDELASRDFWFMGVDEALKRPAAAPGSGAADTSRQIAAMQAYASMKAKVTALRGLIALMAGMDARKSLVIVAHRFGRWPGQEYFAGPRMSFPVPLAERDAQPLLQELVDAANASGVTLYGIYPYDNVAMISAADSAVHSPGMTGGTFGQGADANWLNEMSGLDFVSDKTGGSTAGHPGELPRFLEQVTHDLGSFYSLGFPASGKTKPQAVKVRVKRDGLTVRTRASVAERTPEVQLRDRTLANLFEADGNARIPISLTVGVAKPNGKKYRVPLEVRIPVRSLVRVPAPPAATRGKFSVFVVAAVPNGNFTEVTRRRQEFLVRREEEEKAQDSHLTYTLDVEGAAPALRISLAVWDEIGGEAGFGRTGHTASLAVQK